MYKLAFYNEAMVRYLQIGEYIAQDNLFYANEVLNKLDQCIDVVIQFPFIGREIDKNHRIIVEPNYKFKIVYRIEGKIIYIVSIYREQKDWK